MYSAELATLEQKIDSVRGARDRYAQRLCDQVKPGCCEVFGSAIEMESGPGEGGASLVIALTHLSVEQRIEAAKAALKGAP